MKNTINKWDSLDSEEREDEFEDSAYHLEEYCGTLAYVIEALDEFVQAEIQNRNDAYRCAVNRRLQVCKSQCV